MTAHHMSLLFSSPLYSPSPMLGPSSTLNSPNLASGFRKKVKENPRAELEQLKPDRMED